MNSFRRAAVTIIAIEVILIALFNVIYIVTEKGESFYHNVEAERIALRISEDAAYQENPEKLDISDYKTIIRVSRFDASEICNNEYVVQEVDGTYYRIEYGEKKNHSGIIMMDIGMIAILLATAAILGYMYHKVILPFGAMSQMTVELAKGNLSTPIKEEKSRFFGRFLWGMDMLRENIEDSKMKELKYQKERGEKSLIMTLTKRMSEDLTEFLTKENIRVTYLHSDIKAVERMQILNSLRNDEIDVIVGINLLREGIDLPEVSLLMILDADKEGFLRSETSLVQIIGRCARNENGRVILYADEVTDSMMNAVGETNRRRAIQQEYNEKHGITPHTVKKAVRDVFDIVAKSCEESSSKTRGKGKAKADPVRIISNGEFAGSSEDKDKLINKLTREMEQAAKDLEFEKAAEIRDIIIELKGTR